MRKRILLVLLLCTSAVAQVAVSGKTAISNSVALSGNSVATISAPALITYAAVTDWTGVALAYKDTTTFDVQINDVLVAYCVTEGANDCVNPPTGTLSVVWSQRQSDTSGVWLRLWTAIAASNQSGVTVRFSTGSSGVFYGGAAYVFRGSTGIGTSNLATGASGTPSVTLSSVAAHSVIVMVNGDWAAVTGTRTYVTADAGSFTEKSYYADASRYGIEGGYYADVGSANNKTVGLSAPSGMTWTVAAVEVKGQ